MTNNAVRSKLRSQPTAIAVAVSMLLLGAGAGHDDGLIGRVLPSGRHGQR